VNVARAAGTALAIAAWCALGATVASPRALACSPPFEPTTIAGLGPDQVVVVGHIGPKVPQGRLFHVERWFNGALPRTPIVIAFKEGEPVGDCGYPVHEGDRLIIAPVMLPEGLYADLTTLLADPASVQGRAYVADAERRFGAGIVPEPVPAAEPAANDPTRVAPSLIGLAISVVLLFVVVIVLAHQRRPAR
jgi:hypothetical protein